MLWGDVSSDGGVTRGWTGRVPTPRFPPIRAPFLTLLPKPRPAMADDVSEAMLTHLKTMDVTAPEGFGR